MKRFVVTLEFGGTPPDQEVGVAQARFLDKLHADGTLLLAGPFSDGGGGMAVLAADSLEQVQNLYRNSPLIRSGHATADVREWNVVRGSVQR
ncbi:YciI family protein [Streptomyces sp. NPDC052727]|uniref:YciI family protein n=1 Tax=unclassified Streptomyces TaxID=2593676 RepID=UPI00341BE73A